MKAGLIPTSGERNKLCMMIAAEEEAKGLEEEADCLHGASIVSQHYETDSSREECFCLSLLSTTRSECAYGAIENVPYAHP